MIFFWRAGGISNRMILYFILIRQKQITSSNNSRKIRHCIYIVLTGAIKHGPILDILTNPYTCNLYDEKTDISLYNQNFFFKTRMYKVPKKGRQEMGKEIKYN